MEQEYRRSHIPGALYAHLDRDLSGPVIPGKTGRHPLPEIDVCVKRFSDWGIREQTQVVVYDNAGGAMASRLWWMLQWLGHENAAILDGGWQRWLREGGPLSAEDETCIPAKFVAKPAKPWIADTEEIAGCLGSGKIILLDVRDEQRFLGVEEPLDPVAGHIPGAANLPFQQNLDPKGNWKAPGELQSLYRRKAGNTSSPQIISYCGSGVTACHTFFSLLLAGFGETRIYPGSWSEWIADPVRPVATGPESGDH